MTKTEKTIIELLQEIVHISNDMLEEIKSMHDDVIDLIQIIAETEITPAVTVQTSTAEEIKQALKPISRELIMGRGV